MEAWKEELYHHGIKGMRWGVRRYQNLDGTLTPAGRRRLAKDFQRQLNEKERQYAYAKGDYDVGVATILDAQERLKRLQKKTSDKIAKTDDEQKQADILAKSREKAIPIANLYGLGVGAAANSQHRIREIESDTTKIVAKALENNMRVSSKEFKRITRLGEQKAKSWGYAAGVLGLVGYGISARKSARKGVPYKVKANKWKVRQGDAPSLDVNTYADGKEKTQLRWQSPQPLELLKKQNSDGSSSKR